MDRNRRIQEENYAIRKSKEDEFCSRYNKLTKQEQYDKEENEKRERGERYRNRQGNELRQMERDDDYTRRADDPDEQITMGREIEIN